MCKSMVPMILQSALYVLVFSLVVSCDRYHHVVDAQEPVGLVLLSEADCSPETPCSRCVGDCSSNNDCIDGLACFYRADNDITTVTGCLGEGSPGIDYCYQPNVPPQLVERDCNDESPCGLCEGDCDSDTDCAQGLLCFMRCVGTAGLMMLHDMNPASPSHCFLSFFVALKMMRPQCQGALVVECQALTIVINRWIYQPWSPRMLARRQQHSLLPPKKAQLLHPQPLQHQRHQKLIQH